MPRPRILTPTGPPAPTVGSAPRGRARRSLPGFTRESAADLTLWVDPEFGDAVGSLGLLAPGGLERALESGGAGQPGSSGRTHTRVLALPGRRERLHLRPVRHGGWLGGLWGPRVLGPGRSLAELRVTRTLHERGAPVPRPVLVLARDRRGPFWESCVGTIHAEASCDALAFLDDEPEPARLLAAARAAGAAVRAFHEAGGRHADLHLKNLVLAEPGPRVVVVDLDGARVGTAPGPARRMRELMRLFRSLRKRGHLERVGARGCAAFFGSYVAGDRALRRKLRAWLPLERLRARVHALGYTRPTRTG